MEDGCLAVVRTPKGSFLPGGGLEQGRDLRAVRRKVPGGDGTACCDKRVSGGQREQYLLHGGPAPLRLLQHYYVGNLGSGSGRRCRTGSYLAMDFPLENAAESLHVAAQRWAAEQYGKRYSCGGTSRESRNWGNFELLTG